MDYLVKVRTHSFHLVKDVKAALQAEHTVEAPTDLLNRGTIAVEGKKVIVLAGRGMFLIAIGYDNDKDATGRYRIYGQMSMRCPACGTDRGIIKKYCSADGTKLVASLT